MEPFVVSALKYRPQRFEDVVGQKSITQTLENAIAKDHLAQALLFCGPRGVGKTTCARILAKKINDSDEAAAQDNDFSFNIFELDAASNNSVEDIRNLIDQVRIPPQVGKYKVYIIDEVHMLSQAAFNAFLKTLEEPPAHAIFILATTEKHKIIPTILSRCQIFDFKRIGVTDTKNYLQKIAKTKGIQAEEEALQLIAQKADGAMRDALSIFDRIVSFSNDTITAEHVSVNLNILDFDTYLQITKQLIEGDIRGVILSFDQVLSKGFDGHQFIVGLASHFRDLWMCKHPDTVSLIEVGSSTQKKYLTQSEMADLSFLEKAITLTNECDLQYKGSKNQRLHVELCLMQIASVEDEKKKDKPYIKPALKTDKAPQKPAAKEEPKSIAESIVAKPIEETSVETIQPPNLEKPDAESTTAPAEPVKEKPIALDIQPKGVSGLSLSSIAYQKNVKANQPTIGKSTREETIGQESLETAWKALSSQLEADGEYNLAALLNLDSPRLKNKVEIHLNFPNKTNKLELESEKGKIIGVLADALKNDLLQFVIHVSQEEQQNYVYTPRDKYEQLVKINPLVDDIRKEFNLDLN
ncbi:MAG: DNA polymerase III subunit gamma/tau [Flavobacteriaceae bacterium]|nr:DNA polymerase III subunit gamma/tau [Flavobacteriaceae bacterium]